MEVVVGQTRIYLLAPAPRLYQAPPVAVVGGAASTAGTANFDTAYVADTVVAGRTVVGGTVGVDDAVSSASEETAGFGCLETFLQNFCLYLYLWFDPPATPV